MKEKPQRDPKRRRPERRELAGRRGRRGQVGPDYYQTTQRGDTCGTATS